MLDTNTVDEAILLAFGEDVIYSPGGINPVTILGYFQTPDEELDTGEIDMEANTPRVLVLSGDVPNPTHQDLFEIRGINYQVKRAEVEETTMVVCHLREI